jgi:hypothetical protein
VYAGVYVKERVRVCIRMCLVCVCVCVREREREIYVGLISRVVGAKCADALSTRKVMEAGASYDVC